MDIAFTWWIVGCTIAIVLCVAIATWALLSALIPPQTREVRALRAHVEELGDDLDQVHGRLNERAARENMQKARETRGTKRELVEQAAELVKGQGSPAPPTPAAAADTEAQRAALRRRFLNS